MYNPKQTKCMECGEVLDLSGYASLITMRKALYNNNELCSTHSIVLHEECFKKKVLGDFPLHEIHRDEVHPNLCVACHQPVGNTSNVSVFNLLVYGDSPQPGDFMQVKLVEFHLDCYENWFGTDYVGRFAP